MRINYYAETDSLYIDLSSKPSVDSREVSEGIVLDYDADGNLVSIDIDQASIKLEIKELILSKLPAEVKQVAWPHQSPWQLIRYSISNALLFRNLREELLYFRRKAN